MSLLRLHPTLVRGNASEIMALAGAAGTARGVDSTAEAEDALEIGKALALQYHTIVAITGANDLVRQLTSTFDGFETLPMPYRCMLPFSRLQLYSGSAPSALLAQSLHNVTLWLSMQPPANPSILQTLTSCALCCAGHGWKEVSMLLCLPLFGTAVEVTAFPCQYTYV